MCGEESECARVLEREVSPAVARAIPEQGHKHGHTVPGPGGPCGKCFSEALNAVPTEAPRRSRPERGFLA